MPWCPKCRNEYREGIERCRGCDEPLVDELTPDVEEVAEATQIAPAGLLPEELLLRAAAWLTQRVVWAEVSAGPRLLVRSARHVLCSGHLMALLAVLALLQVTLLALSIPLTRVSGTPWDVVPPSPAQRLAQLSSRIAAQWSWRNAEGWGRIVACDMVYPSGRIAQGISAPASAWYTMAWNNSEDGVGFRQRWLITLWVNTVLAMVTALVSGALFGWLARSAKGGTLRVRQLARYARANCLPLFGFFLLLPAVSHLLSEVYQRFLYRGGQGDTHDALMSIWYVFRAPLALTPFAIVALRVGIRDGVAVGLRIMRRQWMVVLGAWLAYLAALEVVHAIGWVLLPADALWATIFLAQGGLWSWYGVLTAISRFADGWLTFSVCMAFTMVVVRTARSGRPGGV